MDRLSSLLDRFALSAGVSYTGRICGIHPFDRDERQSHFHLIRQGPVTLAGAGERALDITEPTLLFLPRPDAHRLIADESAGADVVCASIRFGGGGRTPITDSLPARVVAPLAGLADPRLAKALTAVHENPARPWQLAEMAALAGMSRARFAAHFRAVTGDTPAAYLAAWRIRLAQGMPRAGRPLKHVAAEWATAARARSHAPSRERPAHRRCAGRRPTRVTTARPPRPQAFETCTGRGCFACTHRGHTGAASRRDPV